MTSRSGRGSPMSTSHGSVAQCCVTAAVQRWGSGLQNISSTWPAARIRASTSPTEGSSGSSGHCRNPGGSGSVQVGSAGEVRASPVSLQYGLQGPCQDGQIAVVDPPVVQLAGELAEQ